MLIRTATRLGSITALAMVMIVGAILHVTFTSLTRHSNHGLHAGTIVKEIAELGSLTHQYLLHRESRPRRQWLVKYNSLAHHLSLFEPDDGQESEILIRLRRNHQRLQGLFSRLGEIHSAFMGGPLISPHHRKILEEREKRVIGESNANIQAMLSDAFRLSYINQHQVVTIKQRADHLLLAVVLVLSAFIAFSFSMIGRSILKPIHALQQGARMLGDGQLAHRVEEGRKDELGALAHGFNRMADKLAQDDHMRRLAEEKLKDHQSRLERTILERTHDLVAARDEALRASLAKGRFLATMSHELRTPLNAVLGMMELLSRTPMDSEQDHFLKTADASGRLLLSVINDVLDFSRIEEGKLSLAHIPFDLRELLDSTLRGLWPLAQSKGLALDFFLPLHTPTKLAGDPDRLRQIFTNLLGNAIKFTPKGGSVLLLGGVASRAEGRVEYLFEVRDTGVGIPENERVRIFDPFTQVDGHGGGTGLGLSICQHLVQSMGGSIGVENNPWSGQGSTFFLTLNLPTFLQPPTPPVVTVAALHRVLLVGRRGCSLLAVEDACSFWKIPFHHIDFPGQIPHLLQEAQVQGRPFDLIIYDHPDEGQHPCPGLPHLDGLPPIIQLLPPLLHKTCGCGSARARVVQKPISIHHLAAVINNAPASKAAPPLPLPGSLPGRVLVVDDNPVNLQLASGMLQALGCDPDCIEVAADGPKALERFSATRFDLIFMDCQMPGMDGFATTRAIRDQEQRRKIPHTPILAFTADVTKETRTQWEECNMDGFISKPVSLAELETKITPFLRKEAQPPARQPIPTTPAALFDIYGFSTEKRQDIARAILSDMPALMDRLEGALTQGVPESHGISDISHSLKGSLANTLFPALSHLTRGVHEHVRNQEWEPARQELQKAREAFEECAKTLRAILP